MYVNEYLMKVLNLTARNLKNILTHYDKILS